MYHRLWPKQTIRTRRLVLRPLTPEDTSRIAELGGDWNVASMTSRMPYPYTLNAARQWLDDQADGEYVRGIELDGALIGVCGYMPAGDDAAEIGYWIGKDYWGAGYATEAAQAIVDHAFKAGKFQALTCAHFHDNPASARVIEKLGFEKLGPCRCWCEARRHDVEAVRYRLPRQSKWLAGMAAPFTWRKAG